MRTPVIAGNWKMNLRSGPARDLARDVAGLAASLSGVEVGVAPPFPYLPAVAAALESSAVWVAGQDCHFEDAGARTGDVSPAMLADVGCSHVILGHSERRHGWNESPELVGSKVQGALRNGLKPIVCVGETLEERQSGRTRSVVLGQVAAALAGLREAELAGLLLAYEPVWAIGTGVNATPEQAGEMHGVLRAWLAERFSTSFAESVRILYGGSVKAANAAELLAVASVDGALVGGASLTAEEFGGILRAAAAGTR